MVSTSALILLAYTLITFVSNANETCTRYEGGCCPGYEWNSELGNCTVCKIGYAGPNCSLQCIYPNYGWKCALECNCSKEYCFFSFGCLEKLSSKSTTVTVFIIFAMLCNSQ